MSDDATTRAAIRDRIAVAIFGTPSADRSLALAQWIGDGEWASLDEAERAHAGGRALALLDDQLAEMTAARAQLATAVAPGSDDAVMEAARTAFTETRDTVQRAGRLPGEYIEEVYAQAMPAMVAAAVRAHHALDQVTVSAVAGGEPPRCPAHGQPGCQQCHLIRPGGLTDGGGCTDCESYAETGMHWDSCPNRAFEVYFGGDTHPLRAEMKRRDEVMRRVAYELEHLSSAFTLSDGRPEHACNGMHIVQELFRATARLGSELRDGRAGDELDWWAYMLPPRLKARLSAAERCVLALSEALTGEKPPEGVHDFDEARELLVAVADGLRRHAMAEAEALTALSKRINAAVAVCDGVVVGDPVPADFVIAMRRALAGDGAPESAPPVEPVVEADAAWARPEES